MTLYIENDFTDQVYSVEFNNEDELFEYYQNSLRLYDITSLNDDYHCYEDSKVFDEMEKWEEIANKCF